MSRPAEPGFALVMAIAILALLSVVVLGLLSLSTIQIRAAGASRFDLQAQANARLALQVALGELQRELGPDQRVSAPAALLDRDPSTEALEGVVHPRWTAVWSSRYSEDRGIWEREDLNGGMRDLRSAETWDREDQARSYLVSGNEGGRLEKGVEFVEADAGLAGDSSVRLVGAGSLGDPGKPDGSGTVDVPLVEVDRKTGANGHYAYWVGDMGTRANIATRNPHESGGGTPLPGRGGSIYQVMLSQESSSEMIGSRPGGGPALGEGAKVRMVSPGQLDLLGTSVADWRREHFHDLTVDSQSVLADTRKGGLKKDLTAYFQSNGFIPESAPGFADGLRDDDRLVGPRNIEAAMKEGLVWADTRHRSTSPRFGLLRRWATLGDDVAYDGPEVDAIIPKPEPKPRLVNLPDLASANLNPASIASQDQPNLVPVLVEGSMYTTVSWHVNLPQNPYPYNVRLHTYPRVVLWNPYNVDLTMDNSMVLLHVNGRKEMWTDGILERGPFRFSVRAQWIWFVGGRSNEFRRGEEQILDSKLYTDPYIGSFYYSIPKTTFKPGECLVFTPDKAAEYSHTNLERNTLTPRYSPEPALNYYFTASELDGGIEFRPTNYWFAPTPYWNIENQSDDFRMLLKHLGGKKGITPEKFDDLPQIAMVSCALQYGAGREPRLKWAEQNKELMEQTALFNPTATRVPNVRTRDGYRLRWFEEHISNKINSGELTGEPYFESAPFANWNPRASYAVRTPWDNVGGTVPPRGQSGGGPWFFGVYTRDLFDQAVSWFDMMPVSRDGKLYGNPFGQPIEGTGKYVLFDIPRRETGVLSLGQLQHAKLSEFVWHPSYAVGQSLADPRVEPSGTAPVISQAKREFGGWDAEAAGWSADAQRARDRDEWARFGRALLQNYALEDHLVYDLSYEVNHSLWDEFFLSTGDVSQKANFLVDPQDKSLPNGRHVLADATRSVVDEGSLANFHRAAYHLMVDGGFNVNSTSVDAWRALLHSTRNRGFASEDTTPFPRVLDPPEGEWQGGGADDRGAWAGFRSLSDGEVDALARAVVREVKRRGPFLSLADFVNRRLADDDTGLMGALQAAIDAAGLNASFEQTYALRNQEELSDYNHPDNIRDATRLDQTRKPSSKAWGAPGFLTQADVLQVLGPALTSRSDTFVIRAYGDAVDDEGVVKARAWCEAVVQRTPVPIDPDVSGLNPARRENKVDFGRRFTIKSFRWMSPEEV